MKTLHWLNKICLGLFVLINVVCILVFGYLQDQYNRDLIRQAQQLAYKSLTLNETYEISLFNTLNPIELSIVSQSGSIHYTSIPEYHLQELLSLDQDNQIRIPLEYPYDQYVLTIKFYEYNTHFFKPMFLITLSSFIFLIMVKTIFFYQSKAKQLALLSDVHSQKLDRLEAYNLYSDQTRLQKDQLIGSLIHNLKDKIINNRLILNDFNQSDKQTNINDLDYNNEVILADLNKIIDIAFDKEVLDLQSKTKIHLDDFILKTYTMYKKQLDYRGIHINFEFESETSIYMNQMALKIIIYNLLSNMARYTKDDTYASISMSNQGKYTKIIFYNECVKYKVLNLDATGTGLVSVVSLVEDLQGKITFKNKYDGFEVILILPNQ